MDFPSLPPYLDPSNWQQRQSDHQQTGKSSTNAQLLPATPPPLPLPAQVHGGGGASSIRPRLMADQARLANIPMPEGPLKCPRCESINTKFCYFNNYSLSQPRHFCKTCRRYWTRGGALRNVPVGGGCRRNNKRSKSGTSKSAANGSHRHITTPSDTTCVPTSNGGASVDATEILGVGTQLPPLGRFMAPLHYLPDNLSLSAGAGLNYNTEAHPSPGDLNFLAASTCDSGALERWRLGQAQQFSSSGSLDPNLGLYPPEGGFESLRALGVRPHAPPSSAGLVTQLSSSLKLEDNNQYFSRQFLGINHENNPFFSSASAWTDFSSFSSSSTRNPL